KNGYLSTVCCDIAYYKNKLNIKRRITMNDSDLCSIRQLARMKRVFISAHALQRFIERNISLEDVHGILKSENNCLIERQAPSATMGKEHKDPRYLVYDKTVNPEIIVVCAISFNGPN